MKHETIAFLSMQVENHPQHIVEYGSCRDACRTIWRIRHIPEESAALTSDFRE